VAITAAKERWQEMPDPLELPKVTDWSAVVRPSRADRLVKAASVVSPLVILLIWEAASRLGALDARFFPPPTSISGELWDLLKSGALVTDSWATLRRILVGMVIGGVPAIALGLLLGVWKRGRQVIMPIFSALYPVPKIAVFPLMLLIFGLGEASKYAIVAVVVFFFIFFNTLTGVLQVPTIYLDVARNANASSLQLFRTVALPGALPGIFTGLRLAIGVAFVIMAAVEFVGADSGLGYLIWSAWQTFAVDSMYVGLVVISVIGYLCMLLIDQVEKITAPWADR
jgi:NitT/TauT family transport system permease protein